MFSGFSFRLALKLTLSAFAPLKPIEYSCPSLRLKASVDFSIPILNLFLKNSFNYYDVNKYNYVI